MAVKALIIASRIVVNSCNVMSHSSNCPSLMIASTILITIARMFSGSGRASERAAASQESASIMIAASLNCGLGPG
jgi:hypothetical protein